MNANKIRQDFPIFKNNPDLVYLDTTATSLKPRQVIQTMVDYYYKYSANIHRGIYQISEKASYHYEKARETIAEFINAKSSKEIIFTRSTTESINLIAYSLGRQILKKNDEIVTTITEHHSNFVPWQQLALQISAKLMILNINNQGNLDIYPDQIQNLKFKINLSKYITEKTRILAITYVSNVLGVINPIKEIISAAKKINPDIITIVDAAQAIPHIKIDVEDLDCDFLVFSGHKMLGPTGVGVLWGRSRILDGMEPFNYGGDMINEVTLEKSSFAPIPHKFEAGTPHISGVIGLDTAIKYLKKILKNGIFDYEHELLVYGLKKLTDELKDNIILYPTTNYNNRIGIITFNLKNIHAHDIGQILADNNICIRVGHHCAQPLHHRLGLSGSCRASLYFYNNKEDIDKLVTGLKKVINFFK